MALTKQQRDMLYKAVSMGMVVVPVRSNEERTAESLQRRGLLICTGGITWKPTQAAHDMFPGQYEAYQAYLRKQGLTKDTQNP